MLARVFLRARAYGWAVRAAARCGAGFLCFFYRVLDAPCVKHAGVAGSCGLFLHRDLEAPWMEHAGILTLYGFSYRDLEPGCGFVWFFIS